MCSDEGSRNEMAAMTEERRRSIADDSRDTRRRSSVGDKARLTRRSESGDADSPIANAVRATSSASRRNSFLLLCGVSNKDKDMEDDSPVNGEPRKRRDSSEHQADRPITFIR